MFYKFSSRITIKIQYKYELNGYNILSFSFNFSCRSIFFFFFYIISSIIIGQCQEEFYWRLMQFRKRISRFGWETINTSNYDNELHFPKKNIGYKSWWKLYWSCSKKILKILSARYRKVRMRKEKWRNFS